MATTLTSPRSKPADKRSGPVSGGGGFHHFDDGRGGGNGRGAPDSSVQLYRLGVWIGLGGIVMLFAAFTSAMVVRRGTGSDWSAVELPNVLWLSTVILLASSFSIEKARKALRHDQAVALRRWVGVTSAMGAAFLASQLLAWSQLADRGVFLASNPASSFFYLLTAAHGVHLLGGVLALAYVASRVWRPAPWPTRAAAIEATALYWHFMDGLWIYLLALLIFWR